MEPTALSTRVTRRIVVAIQFAVAGPLVWVFFACCSVVPLFAAEFDEVQEKFFSGQYDEATA